LRKSTLSAAVDTTAHRDLDAVERSLQKWLLQRWPGTTVVNLSVPDGSGASSELFFVDIAGSPYGEQETPLPLVLRLAPQHAVYPVVDLGAQARCMNVAAHHGAAPVPEVLAVETGDSDLGVPFLLMRRMEGRRAPDLPPYVLEGWMHDLPIPDQTRLWRNSVDMIAVLHSTEIGALPPDTARLPVAGDNALQRMLNYWTLFLQHVRAGGEQPVLEAAVRWLLDQQPSIGEDEGLVWGDASLRNMLFDGLAPVALMDFEFSHVGLRVFDIAFFAIMDEIMARGFADGAPRLTGFHGVHETLDYYEQVSGRQVPEREYLLRMALTYSSLATTRVYQRLASQGIVSAEDVGKNPPLLMLAAVCEGESLPG
jgi:aminoglycoside phosphotransferase (APT) family kinase protein